MPKFTIQSTGDASCALVVVDLHTRTHLPLAISAEDAKALIDAASKSEDAHPRASLGHVTADRTASGVRVRDEKAQAWFDIPWTALLRGIEVVA